MAVQAHIYWTRALEAQRCNKRCLCSCSPDRTSFKRRTFRAQRHQRLSTATACKADFRDETQLAQQSVRWLARRMSATSNQKMHLEFEWAKQMKRVRAQNKEILIYIYGGFSFVGQVENCLFCSVANTWQKRYKTETRNCHIWIVCTFAGASRLGWGSASSMRPEMQKNTWTLQRLLRRAFVQIVYRVFPNIILLL